MKKNIIKAVIVLIVLAIGIATITLAHFNFNLYYSKNVRIEIYLGKSFSVGEVEGYLNEILPDQKVIVEIAGAFKDTISITTSQINEEQLNKIIEKINEVYETELAVDLDTETIYNSNIRGRDIFAPYIVVSTIAVIVITTIFAIMYGKKFGISKVVITTLSITFAGQFLYYFLLSLTQIEISRIIPATSVTIFIASMTYLMSRFSKQ